MKKSKVLKENSVSNFDRKWQAFVWFCDSFESFSVKVLKFKFVEFRMYVTNFHDNIEIFEKKNLKAKFSVHFS